MPEKLTPSLSTPHAESVLGRQVPRPTRQLDTFPNPGVQLVEMEAFEFTSLCPVTGQPDTGQIHITYLPDRLCLESKSLKLYLWTYREEGSFCEALAVKIAQDLFKALAPLAVKVEIHQTARGGIGLQATCRIPSGESE